MVSTMSWHLSIRECFTNELRLVLSYNKPLCEENMFIMEKISPFYLLPNEDAYWNCFGELTAIASWVILGTTPFDEFTKSYNTGQKFITQSGIFLNKYIAAIDDDDIGAAGEAFFYYSVELMKIIYKDLTNRGILGDFHTIINAVSNEINNKGCIEALPRMINPWGIFINGIAKSAANYALKVWNFTVGSPADIEVVDANGNVIYVSKQGSEYNSIPDSLGVVINNGTDDPIKSVIIFGEGPYTVHLIGVDEGTGSLNITQTKNDRTLVSINYEDIPLSSQMTANLSISGEDSEYPLDIDQDGDGSIDQTMVPNSTDVLFTPSAPDPACVSQKLKTTSTLCTAVMNCWVKQIKDIKYKYDVKYYTDMAIQRFGTSWDKAQITASKKGLICSAGSKEEIGAIVNDGLNGIYDYIFNITDQGNKNSINLGSELLRAAGKRCTSLLKAKSAFIKSKSPNRDAKLASAIANADKAFLNSFNKAKTKVIKKGLSCDDSIKTYLEDAINNLISDILFGGDSSSGLPGDLNKDGTVNLFDYNILLENFGQTGENIADINRDGIVDIFDFYIFKKNYGKTS